MKVTLTRELPGGFHPALADVYKEVQVLEAGRPLSAAELLEAAKDTDVLICTVTDRIDDRVLAASSRLKYVATFSVGLDHLDLSALQERGIRLSHTPAVLTDATADLTWALILGCARRLKPALALMDEGRFRGFDPALFLGLELEGTTLAILGFGKIGQAVARRAEGFGMKVIFHSSRRLGDQGTAREVSFEECLKLGHVVSLHCPLNPGTRHLIGRRELLAMTPAAILVNTARGPIVDETALLAHLRTHPGFFAGLDVFEDEPNLTPGLRELPNALCLPHLGSATSAARGAMARTCVEEAIRFAKGERLRYEYRLDSPKES